MIATEEIERRIRKDISIFSENIRKLETARLSEGESRIVELSKMYAKDSESWLAKGDYYTSFSSVSYAHGLLDSILKLKHLME